MFSATEKVADATEIVALWNELKKAEKPERESALDGVPRVLPALMRAEALQKKARQVGFDWPDVHGALAKVREEFEEVAAEIESGGFMPTNEARRRMEIGDLLFSIVNLTRHLKLRSPRNFSPPPTTNLPGVSAPWRTDQGAWARP